MKDILGLLVLAWPLTLLVLIGITFLVIVPMAVSYAAKHGRSKWLWGIGAFLLVYLPIFWDWIPTVVAHKYYCEKEAGFWVYKTLDQWKAENQGVMEGLHQILQPSQKTAYGDVDVMDERFVIETQRRKPISFLTTSVTERRIVDSKTGEILEKTVDVGSGVGNMATGGGVKFWLNQEPCASTEFWKFTAQLERIKGTK